MIENNIIKVKYQADIALLVLQDLIAQPTL